uniref:non-specific serine/threonine protein kinase n=1 Tax=Ditylenchus dipsaci TaxID=166011 RepID=A0A915DF96_9BILA
MQQPYQKIVEIGNGAFGRCFLCKDSNGTSIVLKKVCDDNNDAVNEARIISRLKHKNIVQCFETYRSARSIYMVLEYMEGGNLDALIKAREERSFSDQTVLSYCLQISGALAYVHSKSIVHRDVKPSNILLDAEYKIVKLADFGISVELDDGKQASGRLGTSAYMSPEILEGREFDFKADIWALGCVLYELVERKRAFAGGSELAIQYKICSGTYSLSVDSRFKKLIQAMLVSSASARPDAKGVIDQLMSTVNCNTP